MQHKQLPPLAALERFLLVACFALYLGAIALQILEDLYVAPLEAAIARDQQR
jgi:hypothetical protein